MIVWRGWGVLSFLIAVGAFALGTELGGYMAPGVRTTGQYLAAGALVIAAVANWFLGTALNRPLKLAGVGASRHHSLFFIPMQWWSIVMMLGALVLAMGTLPR